MGFIVITFQQLINVQVIHQQVLFKLIVGLQKMLLVRANVAELVSGQTMDVVEHVIIVLMMKLLLLSF